MLRVQGLNAERIDLAASSGVQASHRCSEGADVGGANVVDLTFSARELACCWNGKLASLCHLPQTRSFPAHASHLR